MNTSLSSTPVAVRHIQAVSDEKLYRVSHKLIACGGGGTRGGTKAFKVDKAKCAHSQYRVRRGSNTIRLSKGANNPQTNIPPEVKGAPDSQGERNGSGISGE